MQQPHMRNTILVKFGGKDRRLIPTLDACVNLENDLGRGLYDVLAANPSPQNGIGLKIRDIALIYLWGLRGGGENSLTLDDVLDLLWQERDAGRYVQSAVMAWSFIAMAVRVDNSDSPTNESDAPKKS